MAYSQRFDVIKTRLDEQVADGSLHAGGITGNVNGKTYSYTAGHADLAKTKAFKDTTLVRQMSDTKLMGTVAFLKLVEDGLLTGHEPLSAFVPAFADAKVIHPVIPTVEAFTPITIKHKSTVTLLASWGADVDDGDTVIVSGATDLNGIPASEINGHHAVSRNLLGQLTFDVSTDATSSGRGDELKVAREPDATAIDVDGETFYYDLEDLEYPVTTWHVMTQTIGYLYNQLSLGNAFGYAESNPTEAERAKRQIQIQLLADAEIPAAVPDKNLPLSHGDVVEWATALAGVPMLFQPGTAWAYGPGVALLGAVVQKTSGQPADDYFEQAVAAPLGMHDTGFFTESSNGDRFADLLVHAPAGWAKLSSVVPTFNAAFNYGENAPKKLVLYDGGAYTSLKDRGIFYEMLRNKGRTANGDYFMSPALIALISKNRIGDLSTLEVSPPTVMPKWGLGSAVGPGADAIFTMSGQTTRNLYWNGAFNTSFSVDFGNRAYVNFVSNMLSFVDVPTENVAKLFNVHMSSIKNVHVNTHDV